MNKTANKFSLLLSFSISVDVCKFLHFILISDKHKKVNESQETDSKKLQQHKSNKLEQYSWLLFISVMMLTIDKFHSEMDVKRVNKRRSHNVHKKSLIQDQKTADESFIAHRKKLMSMEINSFSSHHLYISPQSCDVNFVS